MNKDEQKTTLQVNVPEAQKVGVSANIVLVTTTSNGEVILDFIFSHPNDKNENVQQGTMVSRVILPIKVGKDLNMVLASHLGKVKPE